ncbi:MAG: heme NO-binding domain-containing protein [Bacteroidetes bacterium]|jgi:hypothetical protein|nr:heme NO-binding domain-containing protein [Bacteroidota bacterium]
MYGIVNKSIEELVIYNFGINKWEIIKQKSEIDVDFFISNDPYDDAITYKLAATIAEEINIPLSQVLENFGEWWIIKTGKEKYGSLLEAGGKNLKEFLINLPNFHNRIMLMYPKLTPPEFSVSDIKENSLNLHYFSKRQGLQDFVKGLLIGLGKLYQAPVHLQLIQSRDEGKSHEIFNVNWQ